MKDQKIEFVNYVLPYIVTDDINTIQQIHLSVLSTNKINAIEIQHIHLKWLNLLHHAIKHNSYKVAYWIIQTLAREYDTNLAETCVTRAFYSAILSGNLQVLTWLYNTYTTSKKLRKNMRDSMKNALIYQTYNDESTKTWLEFNL